MTMKRLQPTDFDVITGPSMASACPVVDTVPPAEIPPHTVVAPNITSARTEQPVTAEKADAA
jgi:hypothetical protein